MTNTAGACGRWSAKRVVWRVASHFLDEHWKEIRETLRREKEEGAS
jgi:hypothetical protein